MTQQQLETLLWNVMQTSEHPSSLQEHEHTQTQPPGCVWVCSCSCHVGVIWLCTTVDAPLPLMWLDWTKDYNNCFYSMVSLSQTDVAFRWQVTVIYVSGLISLACSGSKCPPSSSLRSKSKMVKFWQWRCPGLHEKEDILDLMEGEVSSNLYCSLLTGK